jgi:hypothetical protein
MDDRKSYPGPGVRGAYGCDPVTPEEAAEMFASAQRALQRLHRPVASLDGLEVCGWCHRPFPCPGALGTEPGADQPPLVALIDPGSGLGALGTEPNVPLRPPGRSPGRLPAPGPDYR